MKFSAWIAIGFLACLAMMSPVLAQEGHPLVGSWHGTWGPDDKARTDVTLVISFTGKGQIISGVVNPGSNSAQMQKASLDPANWAVHFEADAKDSSGKPVHYVVDGKIEDLGSVHRSIVGTWMAGTSRNSFKVTRD
jgi:hypothetical protein